MAETRLSARLIFVPTFVAAALSVTGSAAQQRSEEQPIFRASTATVVVDVVVRDRQQQPVIDLSADDFEIYEDGRLQQISSFDLVRSSPAYRLEPAMTAAHGTQIAEPPRHIPSVVALVFEQLGPWGRRMATAAAEKLVDESLGPGDFAGVFAIDRALHVLTPYTSDADALRRGLRDAATRAGYPREIGGRVPGAEFEKPEPSPATRDDDPFTRAHATFAALERLVDALQALPGRKSVLLFSEGFSLAGADDASMLGHRSGHFEDTWQNDNRYDRFVRLIERANQAQVAFYTFDAAGLRIDTLVYAGPGRAPYIGLQFLADETGGAFVENTNELAAAAQRVTADAGQYYLLGYSPTNTRLDGKFRRIQVKVKRPGVRVLARRGYRATATPENAQVRAYEVAPLLLLESPTPHQAFPVQVRTLAFPAPAAPGRTAILAKVAANVLTFTSGGEAGAPAAAVTLLARIKDSAGRVQWQASDRFDLSRRSVDEAAPSGAEVLFYREVDLPSETHTLEVIAYDEHGHRGSSKTSTLNVPPGEARGLHASSLLLVKGADRIGDRTAAQHGLRFGEWFLLPRFSEPVSSGSELGVAFAVYADPTSSQPLQARAGIFRHGQQVAFVPVELGEANADGRIAYVGRVPLGSLEPGTFQYAVTLQQGEAKVTRLEVFTIAAPGVDG